MTDTNRCGALPLIKLVSVTALTKKNDHSGSRVNGENYFSVFFVVIQSVYNRKWTPAITNAHRRRIYSYALKKPFLKYQQPVENPLHFFYRLGRYCVSKIIQRILRLTYSICVFSVNLERD
jgi:hypothetical protein